MTRREILAWEKLKDQQARLVFAVPEAKPFCDALETFLTEFIVAPKTRAEDRAAVLTSDEPFVNW